jgi:hypothetical protein
MSMNGNGPIGTILDLGAHNRRLEEKASTPDYDPGTPQLAFSVVAPLVDGLPSFTEAMDEAARQLGKDGWSIVDVGQCAVAGVNESQGVAGFQVVVTAKRS